MKTVAALLLTASLLLNAGLAIALAIGASRQSAPTESSRPTPQPIAPAGPIIDATVWPSMSTGDLPSLVERLREAGFPPDIVRAIVAAQLQESYSARRKAIDPDAESRPFWKTASLSPAVMDALRQLGREQQKQLRDLLGADAELNDPMSRARDSQLFGHLPAEKASDARRIVREFNDLRSDMFMRYGGSISLTAADREKINALEKQMRGELAKIMTPQEFEQYELRGSNTANNVRYQLAAFDPTEAEFRTVYNLQRSFDDRFGQIYSQPSQEEMRARSEAQRQLQDQIKGALGPVRAAEYERATNYEYRTTSQLVARLELPPETTNKVWAVRDEIQQRANQLRQDPSLTSEQRTGQLAALHQEAIEKVAPLLGGARGVEAFKQYGGQWLEQLVPRPRPAPAGARRDGF
jgi:hypothetical protein